MFFVSFKTLQCSQRYDEFRAAKTVSALPPPGITGKICLKSPPKTTTLPPKGLSSQDLIISRIVRSNVSKQCLLIIGASSHTINFAALTNSARSDPGSIFLQVLNSSASIGIPNLECAVLPHSNNNAAIPLDAVFRTIIPLDRIADESALYTKVFPVPP